MIRYKLYDFIIVVFLTVMAGNNFPIYKEVIGLGLTFYIVIHLMLSTFLMFQVVDYLWHHYGILKVKKRKKVKKT